MLCAQPVYRTMPNRCASKLAVANMVLADATPLKRDRARSVDESGLATSKLQNQRRFDGVSPTTGSVAISQCRP